MNKKVFIVSCQMLMQGNLVADQSLARNNEFVLKRYGHVILSTCQLIDPFRTTKIIFLE